MTSGFVFRVENPATVFYLQRVGRTGHLTEVKVSELRDKDRWYMFFSSHTATTISAIAYITAILWASAVIVLMALASDFWGLGVVGIFVFARFCNVIIIRRRARVGWTGKAEPGVRGDLLVLLTQDRWVRMRGYVDDLKAVTSGQWLQDENTFEGWVNAFATILVYVDVALAANIQQFGKILLLLLLIGSVGLLALANITTKKMQMHGRVLEVGERKAYVRRLDMANELIDLHKRSDWAKQMGLIPNDEVSMVTI